MKVQCTAIMLLVSCSIFSQVGIGTTTPNAELEINSDTNLPALELNPQTSPTGTASGQLSVIEDELYLFDKSREKWLSIEAASFAFALEGNVNNRPLEYSGDVTNSGPVIPRNATLVYAAINSSGGNASKVFTLIVTSLSGSVTNHTFQISGGKLTNTSYNIDLNEGDTLQVRTNNSNSVSNPTVLFWVKWRK